MKNTGKLLIILYLISPKVCFGQLDPDFLRYKNLGDINFNNQRYLTSKTNFEKAIVIKAKDEYCFAQIQNCIKKLNDLKTKKQNSEKVISQKPIINNTPLKLEIKTNKGIESISFLENETMRISMKVNEPCYIRLVYRLADDKLILLRNDLKIDPININKWKLLPEEFICTAPFGLENLIGYASKNPFPPLLTQKVEGYTVIMEDLSSLIDKSQSEVLSQKNRKFSENRISILTEEIISEEK